MKDQSNDPSHHKWTLLPQSYISLPFVVRPSEEVYLIWIHWVAVSGLELSTHNMTWREVVYLP